MSDPAGEIVHITQGYIPLSKVLTRLAQTTHNALQDQIAALAKMPLPAAAMNGNSTIPNGDTDDVSSENIAKKTSILNFAMREHRKWVKALVITEWSRKADMVSQLIDLRFHLQGQEVLFTGALDVMGHVKRDLTFARMPSPDLKTALQVLSTGEAAWMPDVSVEHRQSVLTSANVQAALLYRAASFDTRRRNPVDERREHSIIVTVESRGFRQNTIPL
jgi:mediator of RNA polymerase II transcription subunit 14